MKRVIVFIVLAFCQFAYASEGIQINCPFPSVEVGRTLFIGVTGLTAEHQKSSDVTVTPDDGGVMCLPVNTWGAGGGNSIIIFSAQKPGKYKIEVSMNRWVDGLTKAIAEANKNIKISEPEGKALFDKLNGTASEVEQKYPVLYATCEVEVAGKNPPQPPEPPEPPVPPVPTTKSESVLILREAKESTREIMDLIGDMRTSQQLKSVKILILDDEAKLSNGKLMMEDPASIVAVALNGASAAKIELPLIAGLTAEGSLSFVDKLPTDLDGVIEILRKNNVKGVQ